MWACLPPVTSSGLLSTQRPRACLAKSHKTTTNLTLRSLLLPKKSSMNTEHVISKIASLKSKGSKRNLMENGDRSRCDPETLCFQTYHVIC